MQDNKLIAKLRSEIKELESIKDWQARLLRQLTNAHVKFVNDANNNDKEFKALLRFSISEGLFMPDREVFNYVFEGITEPEKKEFYFKYFEAMKSEILTKIKEE